MPKPTTLLYYVQTIISLVSESLAKCFGPMTVELCLYVMYVYTPFIFL